MIAELAILFGVMLASVLLGIPVFVAMACGVVAFAIFFQPIMPPLIVVQTFQQGLDNQAFTAIPYFFLAGTLMNVGGMSARLLRLARAMIAHVRGGLAHANIAASIVFAGISGSAVADAAAVGSVMIPAMKKDGYSPQYAAAVTAASATIGLVIPPSIPMVIFALFTGASVSSLFIAGVVPGLLMGVFLLVASHVIARRRNYPASRWQGAGELWLAFRGSLLALLMPVLVIFGLVGGVATTSEIGAVAALYAAVVSTLVYREASLRELLSGVVQAALDAGRVLVIIAVSGAFIWIVARLSVANGLAAFLLDLQLGPTAILGLVALFLILAGTILEPVTILVVLVPVMVPAALASGIDITHLGIVVILSTSIGLITPPVGILIYITAAQARARALDVVRESAPFLFALLVLLAMVVLIPQLTLWLPFQNQATLLIMDQDTGNENTYLRRDTRLRDTIAYRLIQTMNRMVKPFMEEHSRRFSLTLSEWRVINALAANPMFSGEEIARELHMEKMTVSRSLRSLEKAGRVEHRKDPSNLKRNQWTLTHQGWDLFDSLSPMAMAHQEAFMSVLTARERDQLFRLLDKLARQRPSRHRLTGRA